MINENIITLKKLGVEYTSHIKGMLAASSAGLFERKNELLHRVIDEEERAANLMDLNIEERAINAIAKYQPVAGNLRMIISIMKMSNSLERIGDHCVNISQSAFILNRYPPLKPYIDLPKMKDTVVEMLVEASEALLEVNSDKAKKVYFMDDIVDGYKKNIKTDLIEYIEKDSGNALRAVEILNISGNLERVGDLITNMCEDIIYMKDGDIIRHGNKIITPP